MTDTSLTTRYRILVVDDDEQFAELLRQMLSRDYDVRVAADGQEAFRTGLEFRPELMILDMRMPRWNGLKTLHAFRARAELAKTRSIMLTADASRETVVQAIRAGVCDYIVKTSFTREELLSKIRGLLPKPEERQKFPPRNLRRANDLQPLHAELLPGAKTIDTPAKVPPAPRSATTITAVETTPVPTQDPSDDSTVAEDTPLAEYNAVSKKPAAASADLQAMMDDWD